MEKQITRLYDDVTMPKRCAQRIEDAMEAKLAAPKREVHTMRRPASRRSPVGGLILAVLCIALNLGAIYLSAQRDVPQLQAAEPAAELTQPDWLEIDFEEEDFWIIKPTLEGERNGYHWVNQLLSTEKATIYVELRKDGKWNYYAAGGDYSRGRLDVGALGWAEWLGVAFDENWHPVSFDSHRSYNAEGTDWYLNAREKLAAGWGLHKVEAPEAGNLPDWLEYKDRKLYFLWDGERTDITDQISEETPFTFACHVTVGELQYFAVGGNLEALGWAHWQCSDLNGHWQNCYYHNTEAEGNFHPWYEAALEELGFLNSKVVPFREEDLCTRSSVMDRFLTEGFIPDSAAEIPVE